MASKSKERRERLIDILLYGGLAIIVAVVLYRAIPGVHPLQGLAAPKAAVQDFAGNPVDLSATIGKDVVLINFWASWCPPCRVELPEIAGLAKEYQGVEGVSVIAVSLDASPPAAKPIADELDPALKVYWGAEGAGSSFQVEGLPCTFVIGRDGVVKHSFVGYHEGVVEEMRAAIEAERQSP